MKKNVFLSSLIFLCALQLFAQENVMKKYELGPELQWYPAGLIPGIQFSLNLSDHHSIHTRVGYNIADRKDFGKHDDEQGGGAGITLGYRYFFKPEHAGFFIGGRTDFWKMNIDWKQNTTSGTTKISVLQPTVELGYKFLLKNNFFIAPVVTNGVEINIKTQGEPVGEGFITLVGVNAGWRF